MPALLTDHMVIQRGMPVHIWGTASPGEVVTVSFRDASGSTVADEVGMWSVFLPPSTAGGPYSLAVKGQATITLKDVLVGDVWVASGQSNMEFGLKDAVNGEAEVAASEQPKIRLFTVKRATSPHPLPDAASDRWKLCEPANARAASAVACFFARDLVRKHDVPIGLIQSYWGGTPVEAWMSLRALSADAAFMPVFALWSQTMEDLAVHKLRRARKVREWESAVTRAKAEGRTPPGLSWEAYNAAGLPASPFRWGE